MMNYGTIVVLLILFTIITLLWGHVNLMRGREQMLGMVLKFIGEAFGKNSKSSEKAAGDLVGTDTDGDETLKKELFVKFRDQMKS